MLFLSVLLLASHPALGSEAEPTGDGITPAEEAICDSYSGRAYGLCNAYCEAMDCDSEGSPLAGSQSCERVGDEFAAAAGEAPPCDFSGYDACKAIVDESFPDATEATTCPPEAEDTWCWEPSAGACHLPWSNVVYLDDSCQACDTATEQYYCYGGYAIIDDPDCTASSETDYELGKCEARWVGTCY